MSLWSDALRRPAAALGSARARNSRARAWPLRRGHGSSRHSQRAARSLPTQLVWNHFESFQLSAYGGTHHGVFYAALLLVEDARRFWGTKRVSGTDPSMCTRTRPPAPQRSARPSSATATSMKRPAEGRRMLTIKLNCPARTTDKNGASQPSRPPAPTAGVVCFRHLVCSCGVANGSTGLKPSAGHF